MLNLFCVIEKNCLEQSLFIKTLFQSKLFMFCFKEQFVSVSLIFEFFSLFFTDGNAVSTSYVVQKQSKGETFCSLLVWFCSLFVIFCSLFATFCSLLVTFCSLLVIFCSLLFARCSLLFACFSLLFTRCSLVFACS